MNPTTNDRAASDALFALANEAERRGDIRAAIRFAEEAEALAPFVPYPTPNADRIRRCAVKYPKAFDRPEGAALIRHARKAKGGAR